jgi:hypothetical protein
MCVLVGVDVGEVEPKRLKPLDLRRGFSLNLGRPDAAREKACQESNQRLPESAGTMFHKARNCGGRQCWPPVDKDNVATDAKRRRRGCKSSGLSSCLGTSHQCSASHQSCCMQFENGPVYTASQPKIVGVYNETRHG